MPVILARRAHTGISSGAVHAYQLPDDGTAPSVWLSACGLELDPADVERVQRFTGAPCSACLILAFGCEAQPGPAEAHAPPNTELGTYPVHAPVSPTGNYAVALWGERQVHWVTERAVQGQLDGRDVVQAMCGHLGWGPLDTPPHGWPTCTECRGAPS